LSLDDHKVLHFTLRLSLGCPQGPLYLYECEAPLVCMSKCIVAFSHISIIVTRTYCWTTAEQGESTVDEGWL